MDMDGDGAWEIGLVLLFLLSAITVVVVVAAIIRAIF